MTRGGPDGSSMQDIIGPGPAVGHILSAETSGPDSGALMVGAQAGVVAVARQPTRVVSAVGAPTAPPANF